MFDIQHKCCHLMHCARASLELKELSHFLHYHQSIVFGNNCLYLPEQARTSLTFIISFFIHVEIKKRGLGHY